MALVFVFFSCVQNLYSLHSLQFMQNRSNLTRFVDFLGQRRDHIVHDDDVDEGHSLTNPIPSCKF